MPEDLRNIQIKVPDDLKARLERNVPRGLNKVLIPLLEDLCSRNEADEGRFIGMLIKRSIDSTACFGSTNMELLDELRRIRAFMANAETEEAISRIDILMERLWPISTL